MVNNVADFIFHEGKITISKQQSLLKLRKIQHKTSTEFMIIYIIQFIGYLNCCFFFKERFCWGGPLLQLAVFEILKK